MNTESNPNREEPWLELEFTLLRINDLVQNAFERDLRKSIPGLLIEKVTTRKKEILYRASGYGPRVFVLLGIAIQVFNDTYEIKNEISNRQLEKAPTGSPDDGRTRADAGERSGTQSVRGDQDQGLERTATG